MLSLFSIAATAEPEAPPSMELLEFLAGWETEEGEQIDPLLLLESEVLTETNRSTESENDE